MSFNDEESLVPQAEAVLVKPIFKIRLIHAMIQAILPDCEAEIS
ncbi:hypothetical protein HNR37_000079 [Desulfurispira natronophila]|uniref:Uncharacterized protein n=1 Tax=Desulfurispira natronophila TaxID=682562 RepID=A0A7W8DFT4_9BACT|nr:hypothetical protein [Desulfurispira natronophila]